MEEGEEEEGEREGEREGGRKLFIDQALHSSSWSRGVERRRRTNSCARIQIAAGTILLKKKEEMPGVCVCGPEREVPFLDGAPVSRTTRIRAGEWLRRLSDDNKGSCRK